MGDIESEQAIVVGCITCDVHAVSAGSISNIGAVDTHVDKAVVSINVAVACCCCLIDVVHITSIEVG